MTGAQRRPRVAIIGSRGYPSYYGGFETLIRRLAPYLIEQGWDVTVYSRPGQVVETEADPGVSIQFTRGVDSKSLSTLSYGATASWAATIAKPDVALVMNVANGYFLPVLKARRIPVVLNVDGLEWERDKWSNSAKRVFKLGARLSAKFSDVLISDSTNIADYWQREFDRESTFIPYGGYCDATMIDGSAAANYPGLEPGNFVLAVARLVPENSIDVFLDAARFLPDEVHVVLVGSAANGDPNQDAADALATDRPNVHLMGHVKNDMFLNWLWANAGAYFHGHSVGGTNPALVQAMACGATILARDTVFNREVLGDTGCFVPPEPVEVAKQTLTLMNDSELRAALSLAARARARDAYSWTGVLANYERCLKAAVDG